MKSYTQLKNLFLTYIQNTSSANTLLAGQLINDAHRYLLQKFFNNEFTSTALTVASQQFYPVPSNYSKLKTLTITNGQLKYTPDEIFTREEWDKRNAMPYTSNIPAYFFVYNSNQVGIWPIPSTGSTAVTYTGLTGTFTAGDTVTDGTVTGTILTVTATSATAGTLNIAIPASSATGQGVFATSGTITDSTTSGTATITGATITSGLLITYNYKIKVPDMSVVDITGTCTTVNGSTAISSASSNLLTTTITNAGSAVNLNLYLQPATPKGDNNWYQVSTITSSSALTLSNTYQGISSTAVPFTVGQMPLLLEDFQDLIVYWAVIRYFSTIQKDMEKAQAFEGLYKEGEERLSEYCGTKTQNVNLGRHTNLRNPNLYGQSFGANP